MLGVSGKGPLVDVSNCPRQKGYGVETKNNLKNKESK